MASHHERQRELSQTRKLRKKDKRAAVILLTLYRDRVSPKGFGIDSDGRYSYEWRCSYEYNEWDWSPASDYLSDQESNDWLYEHCIDDTGEYLPYEMCPPRPPSSMKQLPDGHRWRGRRVVPVDKHGAMLPTAKGRRRALKPIAPVSI